jgi:hypothetical protein
LLVCKQENYRYKEGDTLLQLADALLVEVDGGGLAGEAGLPLVNGERLADEPEALLLQLMRGQRLISSLKKK